MEHTEKNRVPASILFLVLLLGALLGSLFPAYSLAEDAPLGYQIAPEDVLEVSVWREPELQRQVVVRPDGGISLPLVGDVQAAGLTPSELEETVQKGLSEFIPDAVVNVSVIQLKGLRVYVTGQVRRPGQYEVGRYIDVLQAITLAGGFTPFANQKKVRIIRKSGGTEEVFNFNYREVERGRNLEQNIRLRSDDIVVVP